MSAELFGDRFIGYRVPAWHNLGKVFDAPIGAVEGVLAAQCDYFVHKVPVQAAVGEIDGVSSPITLDRVALMREPTHDDPAWVNFGMAGTNYGLLQNTEVAAILEPLTDKWPVETVGALKEGKIFFITLSLGDDQVADEAVKKYLMVADHKTGKDSLRFAICIVRVVCMNTHQAAWASALNKIKISHSADVVSDLQFTVNLYDHIQTAEHDVMEELRVLGNTKVSVEQVEKIIAAAYPPPSPPAKVAIANEFGAGELSQELQDHLTPAQATYQYYLDRSEKFNTDVFTHYKTLCEKHASVADTAWLAVQSVYEVEDWRKGPAGSSEVSALFGHRANAKQRAYSAAMAIVR